MTPGYLILAAAAALLFAASARAAWLERRGRRWEQRRRQVIADRRKRDDQGYGDELAIARVMMRPSLPDTPMLKLDPWSVKVTDRTRNGG